MRLQRFQIVHAAVARSGCTLYGPQVFHVQHQGGLRFDIGTLHLADLQQPASQGFHIPEFPGIAAAVMIYHGAMEFFRGAPALAELKVLHGIRAVRHGLHACRQMHAGALQPGHRRPVCGAGRALHQQEGLLFEGAHHIMPKGKRNCLIPVIPCLPLGIAVPGNDIQVVLEFEIVIFREVIHEIGGDRQLRSFCTYRLTLFPHEIHHLICGETLPIQPKAVGTPFPIGHRRVDLFPAGIGMAPEGCPPLLVQLLQRTVFLLQPAPKGFLAQGAPADASVFIGQVPQDDAGMLPKPPGKSSIYLAHLFPVIGGGVTVIVALSAPVPHHMV